MDVTYRTLRPEEAEAFWQLMDRLDHETNYMLYEPGERTKDLSRLEAVIRGAAESGDFLLVAEADGVLVGYISAQKGDVRRTAHSAYIVTGIRAQYRRKGIGTEFFKRLDGWAQENGLQRLELTVVCENEAAVGLYRKSGFRIEGTRRKAVLLNGTWLDEYYMAKVK